MSESEFTAFLSGVYALMCRYSTDGSIHQICMDWRHMREMLAAGDSNYSELKNVCIWNKTNAGMERSTAQSMRWFLSGRMALLLIPTLSNLVSMVGIARMSGIMTV